jgi:hypothetical protein
MPDLEFTFRTCIEVEFKLQPILHVIDTTITGPGVLLCLFRDSKSPTSGFFEKLFGDLD